ncbi:hypothetical protein LCGC14_2283100, partial [marine sediment metagenome]
GAVNTANSTTLPIVIPIGSRTPRICCRRLFKIHFRFLCAPVRRKVARIQADIALADALVEKVLEPGIDYGLHPGTRSQALKDPGAATIINAFNCYPKAEVLFREVTDVKISYVFDVALISREDGLTKCTGTGACTTMETRYGYRWVTDPEAYGFDRASLKTRSRDGRQLYRITNPDWSELENTILKMARKRAEVDAAMALPGVSRFMSKLNTGQPAARSSGPPSSRTNRAPGPYDPRGQLRE